MKVIVQADMAAHKIVTMVERSATANRDIFDVWFFLKNNWPINEKIVELRTGVSLQQFLYRCIKMLASRSDRGILSDIGELVTAQKKYG